MVIFFSVKNVLCLLLFILGEINSAEMKRTYSAGLDFRALTKKTV